MTAHRERTNIDVRSQTRWQNVVRFNAPLLPNSNMTRRSVFTPTLARNRHFLRYQVLSIAAAANLCGCVFVAVAIR